MNRTKLLVNIAKQAPWLIDGRDAFFPERVEKRTEHVVKEMENCPLTIVCDNGLVSREQLSITIRNNELKINKPSGWENVADTFHVFFKCRDQNWYFFAVENAVSYPMAFCAPIPKAVYSLQKRRHPRVITSGTMGVIFRNDINIYNNAYIHDISVGGMLICENSGPERYHVDSVVSDIFISVSSHNEEKKTHFARKIWPLINKGRIVRTSFDQESSLSYYGIMFQHKSFYVKEALEVLIDSFPTRNNFAPKYESCHN